MSTTVDAELAPVIETSEPEIEIAAQGDESLPPRIQAVADLLAGVIARRINEQTAAAERR